MLSLAISYENYEKALADRKSDNTNTNKNKNNVGDHWGPVPASKK